MITIVNYGSGNIQAIANIYKELNIPYKVASTPEELADAVKLILPGVGAFDKTMSCLKDSGLQAQLDELVLEKKIPVLGICVGMQIMSDSSEEGELSGLGWIKGKVKKFDITTIHNKPHLPHMGWNAIKPTVNHPILEGIDEEQGFYFIHTYYYACQKEDNILTHTDYGGNFASSIFSENIFGAQFHPEKSHSNGIKLLRNFANL